MLYKQNLQQLFSEGKIGKFHIPSQSIYFNNNRNNNNNNNDIAADSRQWSRDLIPHDNNNDDDDDDDDDENLCMYIELNVLGKMTMSAAN